MNESKTPLCIDKPTIERGIPHLPSDDSAISTKQEYESDGAGIYLEADDPMDDVVRFRDKFDADIPDDGDGGVVATDLEMSRHEGFQAGSSGSDDNECQN